MFQCFECDGPDPLKTERVTGWLKSDTAAEEGPPGTFVGFKHAELMFLKSTRGRKGTLLIPSPPLFGFYR
jgi:hypothetical protein